MTKQEALQLLQRSRRPRTTESRAATRGPRQPQTCFNEAVVRGRRRGTGRSQSGSHSRCFNEAVVRGRRRARLGGARDLHVGDASTKPSSEDDGEVIVLRRSEAFSALLQRSRRPRTTESPSQSAYSPSGSGGFNEAVVRGRRRARGPTRRRPRRACFNEAVVRGRRRDAGGVRERDRNESASTKPSSEDDGEASSLTV